MTGQGSSGSSGESQSPSTPAVRQEAATSSIPAASAALWENRRVRRASLNWQGSGLEIRRGASHMGVRISRPPPTSRYGMTSTWPVEAVQLFVSFDSVTALRPSAHAMTR